MVECQESSSKLLSIRGSIESTDLEVESGDEQFYEEIEAPKFVDFTAPHHYCPDDRYWFCLRVGCDQKHEEEMDSETIYKNFVLRVMAARSPNIRLRKALERNASRSPSKCPLSAPPKRSKPRLSNMAIISSISKKTDDGKKGVVRSLLKPKPTTPAVKTKPVAAKYLTTPRNRACQPNPTSFRSVQNPKPAKIEVPKSRVVAKGLVFRSPRKTIKVKTSVELRTPISKLCEGVRKLEISSQKKRVLGYSSKSYKNLNNTTPSSSSRKVQGRPCASSLSSQRWTNQEAKSGKSIKGKVKGKLEQKQVVPPKLVGSELNPMKKQLSDKVEEEDEVKEAVRQESCISSEVETSTMNSDLALLNVGEGKGNCVDLEGNDNLSSQATEGREVNSNDGNGKGSSESCGEFMNHSNTNNSSEEQKHEHEHEYMDGDSTENAAASSDTGNGSSNSSSVEQKHEHVFMDGDDKENVHKGNPSNYSKEQEHEDEFMDGDDKENAMDSDDKENAAASNENRIHNKHMKLNGRKLLSRHDKGCQVKKEDARAESKREGMICSSSATKFKKPKPTNPKPFRLRTDERGVLKEANLDRRTGPQTPCSETENLSTPNRKLHSKRGSGIQLQKKTTLIDQKVVPLELQSSKAAATPLTPQSNKRRDSKPLSSPLERLERFRKMKSHIQKPTVVRPQGSLSTKKEMTSFLIPGQKLDVIHEMSPDNVCKAGKTSTGITLPVNDSSDCATLQSSSSCGKRPITVAREPNFHITTHVPRTCTKSLAR